MKRLRNSAGIWSFGANATRFLPTGHHPAYLDEDIVTRSKRVAEGLGDWIDGYEFHYPTELNEDNLNAIEEALGAKDIYAIPLGFHSLSEFSHGSFVHPEKKKRERALLLAKKAIDLCEEVGAHLIIWSGAEGYHYPFHGEYIYLWKSYLEGIANVVDYASSKKIVVLLEHKNSEPARKVLMRNIGMTLFTIYKVREMGVDVQLLKVNMDFQHLLMNGEPLAEYAALLGAEGLLGHLHANSGWGPFDEDAMVGAMNFMELLGVAKELQRMEYGQRGERVGFDLFPLSEDPIEAARQSVIQWEFLYDLAESIEEPCLKEAQERKDALTSYQLVYKALGLNQEYRERILRERQKK